MQVQLTMSEQQAKTVIKALDFYSRIHGLQFDELAYLNYGDNHQVKDIPEMIEDLEILKKKHFDFGKGSYIGVAGIAPGAQLAYDMRSAIQHPIAWFKNPRGGCTVDFYTPMHMNKKHDLIKVEVIPYGKQEN